MREYLFLLEVERMQCMNEKMQNAPEGAFKYSLTIQLSSASGCIISAISNG
jgi:hypothetical protein